MRTFRQWVTISIVLVILGTACNRTADSETAVCNFTDQTAVTVHIQNENGEPQRLVNVRYQLDDGPWQALPEVVNERVILRDGPGTYRIRFEKPGYTAEEIAVVVAETAEGSCQVAEETVTLPMALAVCPNSEPALLDIEIVSASKELVVTAVSPQSGSQPLTCAQPDAESCAHFSLPLNNIGSYRLTVDGLAGLGPMRIANETISYTLRTSQITLRQANLKHSLTVTGANSLNATFNILPDEIGCPLADFRSLTTQIEPDINGDDPYPKLAIEQQNNLTITDLGNEACQAAPEPYPVLYEATLPVGTPLNEVGVFTLQDGDWREANCALTDGRFLCTTIYPNPFIGQPYAYKVVAAGEEYVGTSLPFDNLCLIFE